MVLVALVVVMLRYLWLLYLSGVEYLNCGLNEAGRGVEKRCWHLSATWH